MTTAMTIQLPLSVEVGQLPFDPLELTQLSAPERGGLYASVELDFEQRQAAEDAVRRVIRGQYGRRRA